jgi:1-deoxy-D-xylulose-5-phosphate reductoisomerase
MRNLSILGSTGSIGSNTLKVVDANPGSFNIKYLTAGNNAEKLIRQARKYEPEGVAIANADKAGIIHSKLAENNTEILEGREGILEIAGRDDVDLVVNSIVGPAGMEPTYRALQGGNDIALSNKESLVMGGNVIMDKARKNDANIYPVDSEHNAIWQCLRGESISSVDKLILTASGGPFRNLSCEELQNVSPEDALDHPTWNMGKKITIDSATMMNKGFELIEAYWLFDMAADRIEVVVHPQSIIHSMVEFKDGSIKAQLGLPDMKLPIQYALFYPDHQAVRWENTDLTAIGSLTFEQPDYHKSPCLKLARQALIRKGTAPAILNVANDLAVHAFLAKNIGFTSIPEIIEKALNNIEISSNPELDDILEVQIKTEKFIEKEIKKRNR